MWQRHRDSIGERSTLAPSRAASPVSAAGSEDASWESALAENGEWPRVREHPADLDMLEEASENEMGEDESLQESDGAPRCDPREAVQEVQSIKDGLATTARDVEVRDPFDPSKNALPSLLQCLTVDEIMEWRLTSRQASSPRALIHHLAELGRLDRSESICDFAEKWTSGIADPDTFNAEIAKDLTKQKFFECRWWCMKLAHAEQTHFPESDVRKIVSANLADLLVHCSHPDETVRRAARDIVWFYGVGSLPFVQQLIAEAMLGQMGDLLLPESSDISRETSTEAMQCSQYLKCVLRALSKPQRQKWVSLLVRVLQSQNPCQNRVMEHLKLLWRADDDPRRSYAEAKQQLKAFSEHANRDLRRQLWSLYNC
ncbi:unnamed protein product [Symbiodinium sp. CCMP2592]|nr:unnamed protein product [Symbiodinium sp. CCMP2592]